MKKLQELNPDLPIFSVTDPEFAPYGRLRNDIDGSGFVAQANTIPMIQEGSAYTPSVSILENVAEAKKVQNSFFGGLATQIGYCYGHNNQLNALEWHIGSELNVAVTPLVLFLALQSDLKDGKLDSASVKAFYVPQGAVIEIYDSVLHFCPCEVDKSGFGCVVGLLEGTNIPFAEPVADKVLFKKNKWLLAHNDNKDLIEKGIVPGITGENLILKY